ncbi:MAG: hypothetical protein U5J96_15360 [Ignavibacteriaceae bacterium]|nr:hypothetical protein [Ignavibacteriaceae bacterium]
MEFMDQQRSRFNYACRKKPKKETINIDIKDGLQGYYFHCIINK